MIHYKLIKSYLMLLKVKCDNIRIMGICVINIVPSQQEDPVWLHHLVRGFLCGVYMFSPCLHGFFPTSSPQPKDIQLVGLSQMVNINLLIGVNVSANALHQAADLSG